MKLRTAKTIAWLCLAAAPAALATAQTKQFRFPITAGAIVSINNPNGPVTLHPAPGRELLVTATLHSAKVEVDETHSPQRVDLGTHFLQNATGEEGRVDYDVAVPAGVTVSVHASTGPIQSDKVSGDLTFDSDAGAVEVRGASASHVRAHTIQGAITLSNLQGHVEVSSVGGNLALTNVSGPRISADTNTGTINFSGDCAGAGDYSLSTHSGDIVVTLPTSASVLLNARSVSGAVQNDFPFQPVEHSASAQSSGHAFAGRANSAAASLQLRSFSGTIRVKKQ